MTTRRTVLQVEELGSRVLPSVSPLALHGLGPFVVQGINSQHALVRLGIGGYTSTLSTPDTGIGYHLEGTGYFGTAGAVTVAGDLHRVGFIQNGHAAGTLTFTNAHGSITLELTGPKQDSFSPLPHQFHYHVIGGTGAYRNYHADGTLQLQLTGSTGTPGNPGQGVFTLRI